MGRARVMYQDESRNSPFNHDKALAILRQHAKWDAPKVAPVELTEDETGDFHTTVNTDELFGADPRPRPPGKQRPRKKNQIRHIGEHRGKSIVLIRVEPNSEGSGSAWKEYVNARVVGIFLLVLLEYPNGSGSAWKEYVNARVAGLFLLVLLEYPNGKGVVRVTSRDSIWHYTGWELGPIP
nr:hypothetical protein [Tanacetum cinerariifolium]